MDGFLVLSVGTIVGLLAYYIAGPTGLYGTMLIVFPVALIFFLRVLVRMTKKIFFQQNHVVRYVEYEQQKLNGLDGPYVVGSEIKVTEEVTYNPHYNPFVFVLTLSLVLVLAALMISYFLGV